VSQTKATGKSQETGWSVGPSVLTGAAEETSPTTTMSVSHSGYFVNYVVRRYENMNVSILMSYFDIHLINII
jgi:hypothetical protein